jgi:hypothetical protein
MRPCLFRRPGWKRYQRLREMGWCRSHVQPRYRLKEVQTLAFTSMQHLWACSLDGKKSDSDPLTQAMLGEMQNCFP